MIDKLEKLWKYLKRAIRWIRGSDADDKILEAIKDTKEQLMNKINENELDRLKTEITRYYNKMISGQEISREEYTYLLTVVFHKYKSMGGNSICAHMMESIEKYITSEDE